MILSLAQSLFRLFREHSDVIPVSQLKRQGVRSVTVLDWDRVQSLITRAVGEALDRRGVQLSREDMRSVSEEALETFHRLVEQRDHLQHSAKRLSEEKASLEQNLRQVRDELERAAEELTRERSRSITVADVGSIEVTRFEEYAERLAAEMARLADGGSPASELPEPVLAVTRRFLEQERARALATAKAEQRRRVEQLERRVDKLKGTLSHTEKVMQQMQRAAPVDGGVESVYRGVQGLDSGDKNFQEKRGVLDQIFQLNVDLRQVIEDEAAR